MAKHWKTPLRLYLTGRLTGELGDRRFDERRLPGRQGRRALVYLALERARPVPIDELADAVWGTATPSGAWETALSAIVSKLRAALRGLDPRCTVTTAAGCYQPAALRARCGQRPAPRDEPAAGIVLAAVEDPPPAAALLNQVAPALRAASADLDDQGPRALALGIA